MATIRRLLVLTLGLALVSTAGRAAETCAGAVSEEGPLPLSVDSTSTGGVDDYNLPDDVTPPTCTASSSCAGTPEGKGYIYDSTGKGPDVAFKLRTSANCELTITLDPTDVDGAETDADDLALVVYQSACSSAKSDCACVSDAGLFGESESVVLQAVAGTTYYLVVDGSTPFGIDPDPPDLPEQGPFDLDVAVTSGSCTLCPEGGCGVSPPDAPAGLTASDGSFTDRVALSWSAASGAPSSYDVFRDTGADPTGASKLDDTTATSFDDSTASPGVTYTYWVKACNAGGCSGYSASDTGFRAASPPSTGIFVDGFEECGAAWSVPPPPCS